MKTKRIKSAIPFYLAGAVWLLIGLLKPSWLLHAGTFLTVAIATLCWAALFWSYSS